MRKGEPIGESYAKINNPGDLPGNRSYRRMPVGAAYRGFHSKIHGRRFVEWHFR